MRRPLALLLIGVIVVCVFGASDATGAGQMRGPNPKTVDQFHRLPKQERRQFAIHYMTTHGVSPCDGGRLTREEARNIAAPIVKYVQPGRDADDGSYIKPSTPIGAGIRHILDNIGC